MIERRVILRSQGSSSRKCSLLWVPAATEHNDPLCTPIELVARVANRPNVLQYEEKTPVGAASTSMGRTGKACGDDAPAVPRLAAACHALFSLHRSRCWRTPWPRRGASGLLKTRNQPIHSSGISPMDCKSSRHVSEQLSCPTCSAHPSGRGSPRRTWVCRLHCVHRMVTSGAFSGMLEVLLV